MSCRACDEEERVAYVRIGVANVGLIGCDEHLREILGRITGQDYSQRVIFRIKQSP